MDANELLIGGRYWVGVCHSIFRFPKSYQLIVFADSSLYKNPTRSSLIARTTEGLPFNLQVAVYYKLTTNDDPRTKAKQLKQIYADFGNKWEDFLVVVSEAGIKSVCSKHQFQEFYTEREAIEAEIKEKLQSEFNLYYIQLTGLYILDLKFPKELEEAIQATENAKQEVTRYERLRERELILKETKIALAEISREILIAQADSLKNAAEIHKEGDINGNTQIWNAYNTVLENLKVIV